MSTTHLLARVSGGYAAGTNQDESWSFGLRLAIVYGDIDPKGDLPDNLEVFDAAVETAGGDYTLSLNYGIQVSAGATFSLEEYLTDALEPAFRSFWDGAALCAANAKMERIQVYPITGPRGLVSEKRSAVITYDTPVSGSSGGSMMPLEVAEVISWQTGRLGPKGRGRIYLPARTVGQADANGRITQGTIDAQGPGVVSLLQDLFYDSVANPWQVRPIVTGKPYAQYATITGVRIGHVFDAQRRRRNQLDEAYTSFDV